MEMSTAHALLEHKNIHAELDKSTKEVSENESSKVESQRSVESSKVTTRMMLRSRKKLTLSVSPLGEFAPTFSNPNWTPM